MNNMQLKKLNYKGWANCYRMSNGLVELIATTDVGPRLIRFGFAGDDNEFKEFEEMLGQTGGNEWRNYGGHRLWHAPEAMPRTYSPDNSPVNLEKGDGFVRLVQPPEPATGIQKEMDISLVPDTAQAVVTHRLRNFNMWAVKLAPWALTVLASSGVAIVPLPPRGPHPENLRPTSALTLWAYTDMSDPRWTWGRQYLLLHQDPEANTPQKIGLHDSDGWAAYARNGHLFVKTFDYQQDVAYPDFNSTVEVFTDAQILEVETLGPLVELAPGATAEHVERWFLFRDVPAPEDDVGVEEHVLPKIKAALKNKS
ncbi:MAG: hypothetical protein PVH03_11020 [Chloroflexota bacterium]|jgi:hypothetical protein